ncbi:MAG: hypothetical protein ACMUJM_00195 [bacterium]
MGAERSIIRLSIVLIISCLYIISGIHYTQAQNQNAEQQLLMGRADPMQMLYGGMGNPATLIEQALLASTLDLRISQASLANLGPATTVLDAGIGAYLSAHIPNPLSYASPYGNLMGSANPGMIPVNNLNPMGGGNVGMLPLQQMTSMASSPLPSLPYQGYGLKMQESLLLPYSGGGIGGPSFLAPMQGTGVPVIPPYDPYMYESYFLRSANRPSTGDYYAPYIGGQYPTVDMYPLPGTEYYIDTYGLGLDLFNPQMDLRIRTPIPGGFIVAVTETPENGEMPIDDVEIYLYDERITPERGSNGLYFILLQPGIFQLTFKKEGYIDYIYPPDQEGYITSSIPQYLHIRMEQLQSHSKPISTSHSPELEYIPDIEVIAGERVVIEPIVHHPDGERTYIRYSGWMDGYMRFTTDNDVGWHQVHVTAIDEKGYSDTEVVNIYVYYPYYLYLHTGLNLIAYPFEDGNPEFTAKDLLEYLNTICGCVSKISNRIDSSSGSYKEVKIDSTGNASGTDFHIELGKGYQLYASDDFEIAVPIKYNGELSYIIDLKEGLNLIGVVEPKTEGYTSYDMLRDLEPNVNAIYRYNAGTGQFEMTYWLNGKPAGTEFEILPDEGYRVEMQSALSWNPRN